MDERLERIGAFVNTYAVETSRDAVDSPAALRRWLEEHGLGRHRVTRADVSRAAAAREALRALLVEREGGPASPEAPAALDRQAARSGVRLGFDAGGATVSVAAAGVDAALGRLLGDVHLTMTDGSWQRLKACRAHDCRWVFVDGSRNGSRQWCSMEVCGNRAKARRFRARHAVG